MGVLTESVERLRLFIRQHLVGGCKVLSDPDCRCLLCDVDNLVNEVERLSAGQFTEEEFQNLCHQRKLFGNRVTDDDEAL